MTQARLIPLAEAIPAPRLQPGRMATTPGVDAAVPTRRIMECVSRHFAGDWGVMSDEDRKANNAAVKNGARVLSAYPIDPAKPCNGYHRNTLWIITEADRSVTTVLLPSEH